MDDIDYGNCIPQCPICGGLGFIGYEGDYKAYPCPNKWFMTFPNNIGLSEREAESLEYNSLYETPAKKVLAPEFKRIYKAGSGMLYVHGDPGLGKSVLLKSYMLWLFFEKSRRSCLYINHSAMMDELRNCFGDKKPDGLYERTMDRFINLDVLMVDECGRDKDSAFSLASWGKILDRRYEAAKAGKGITLMASNFDPTTIFEPYIIDRLSDKSNVIIALKGDSLRKSDVELIRKPGWWKKVRTTI